MRNLIAMLIGAFLISGCATITDGSLNRQKQKIYFTTPSGKSVIAVIDEQRVTLPAVVEVKKSGDVTISVLASDNPRYQNYTASLSSLSGKERRPAWWYNVTGGLLSTSGSLTDSAFDSTYQYSQPVVIIPVNEK